MIRVPAVIVRLCACLHFGLPTNDTSHVFPIACVWILVKTSVFNLLCLSPPFHRWEQVLTMDQRERLKIAAGAQKQAEAFSQERFLQDFTSAVGPALPH